MRPIDGDALEKYLSDAEIEAIRQRKYVFASALNTICGNVKNFPTIEPEPQFKIMRCKDCKYAKYADGKPFICSHPENNAWRIFDDFYCGRSKRKDEKYD